MKISCNVLKKYINNSEKIDFLKIWDTFTIRTLNKHRNKTNIKMCSW
jgi:hypothetical protein